MKVSHNVLILGEHKTCSPRMMIGKLALLFTVALLLIEPALAGSKQLTVAFVDYSADGVGRASFKALRASGYQDKCWQNFVEIDGIETAYIDKVPSGVLAAPLKQAAGGNRQAIRAVSQALSDAELFGVYIFMPDAAGKTATIYGVDYHQDKLSRSKPIVLTGKKLIDKQVLSKRLCEASKVMD